MSAFTYLICMNVWASAGVGSRQERQINSKTGDLYRPVWASGSRGQKIPRDALCCVLCACLLPITSTAEERCRKAKVREAMKGQTNTCRGPLCREIHRKARDNPRDRQTCRSIALRVLDTQTNGSSDTSPNFCSQVENGSCNDYGKSEEHRG